MCEPTGNRYYALVVQTQNEYGQKLSPHSICAECGTSDGGNEKA